MEGSKALTGEKFHDKVIKNRNEVFYEKENNNFVAFRFFGGKRRVRLCGVQLRKLERGRAE